MRAGAGPWAPLLRCVTHCPGAWGTPCVQGSNPQAIIRHLPKCFDNIHNLEFAKDAEGKPTKTAVGMYSGEGEYVAFAAPCSCEGAVEVRGHVCTLRRPAG